VQKQKADLARKVVTEQHSNPDVVVVGAGAAGIGAGLELERQGVAFLIAEAKDRIGGRAFADTAAFGWLWDQGCQWLHSADTNPLAIIAKRMGHEFLEAQAYRQRIMLGDRWAEARHVAEAQAAVSTAFKRISEAGRMGKDVPASTVVDLGSPWGPISKHWLELVTSVGPDSISTLDFANYRDSEIDWAVKDGCGRFIGSLGADLPISLSTPVTAIEATATGVKVHTSRGTLIARVAILTVPISVLAQGRIRMVPAPDQTLETAFANIQMGDYEKVAILFEGNPVEQANCEHLICCNPRDREDTPVSFELGPFGRPLVIAHVAGYTARRLRAEARRSLADYVVGKLVEAFGARIRSKMLKVAVTGWSDDPWIGGAYSMALPGHADDRKVLCGGSIGERVLLAGEACHRTAMGTCHGAYESGKSAAHSAIRLMGRESLAEDLTWIPERLLSPFH
jgi:monoamine oxidase